LFVRHKTELNTHTSRYSIEINKYYVYIQKKENEGKNALETVCYADLERKIRK